MESALKESTPLMVGLRGTHGIELSYGPPQQKPVEFFNSLKVDSRFMVFSPQGRYLVYHTPTGVQLTDIVNKETLELGSDTVLVREAAFSPKEGFLVLWDAPSKKENNSCTIYDLKTRTVKAMYAQNDTTWRVRWSHDEQILFLMGKDQTYIFDYPEFSTPVSVPKTRMGEISISPVSKPYHVIVFSPCKSTPSFVRLFRYPNVDDPASALAARAVIKEDQVVFKWNSGGTHVLFLASADSDERSYYGSSQLFLMNTSSDSLIIGLDQEGPIHAWEWNPKGDSFCIMYGFMPGKTCIFSKKGDLVHTFGASQYRNGLLYNPFGNLLVLYGHGNIRGAYEVWDLKAMKKVSSQEAEYMTYIEWAPDGVVILCATTSPRLKVGNRYQFWHYTGKALHDQPYEGELFQVSWRPAPPETYTAPDPSTELGKNYVPNEPKKATAYVPPSMRGRTIIGLAPAAGATVHMNSSAQGHVSAGRPFIPGLDLDDDSKKKPKRKKKSKADGENDIKEDGAHRTISTSSTGPGSSADYRNASHAHPQSEGSPASHSAPRHPKSVHPRRSSLKTQDNGRPISAPADAQHPDKKQQQSSGDRKPQHRTSKEKDPAKAPPTPEPDSDDENTLMSSGDPEKDKKIARLNKKLAEITTLKQEQSSGKILEKNQLDKIKRLDSIMKDLDKLQLSAILKKK